MITRHHIALSLICMVIFCMVPGLSDPVTCIAILAGTAAGAVLPDIQMKRPSKIGLRTAAWILVQTGRLTVVPVMCRICALLGHPSPDPSDKRLTHSLPGITLFALLYSGLLAIAVTLAWGWTISSLLLPFLAGMVCGMILHLVHDLCCRKGIAPFFPFSNLVIYGSIRPCDIYDPRIPRFHLQHVSIFIASQLAVVVALLPADALPVAGLFGASTCILSMVLQSGIRSGRGRENRAPVDESVAL